MSKFDPNIKREKIVLPFLIWGVYADPAKLTG